MPAYINFRSKHRGPPATPSPPPVILGFTPVSGPVAISVVITGTNFATANTVTFNGVPASFVIDSPEQITAIVPGAATTGLIVVFSSGGTDTSDTSFQVVAPSGYTFPTTPYRFPSLSGYANVRSAPFNAQGNGSTNDTAAIQACIDAQLTGYSAPTRAIYIPDGTYVISDRLIRRIGATQWVGDFWIQGESESGTILKLANNAPGYNNPSVPKAVIYQSSGSGGPNPFCDYPGLGEGNEAFRSHVADLTIQLGSGNAGAVGIDSMSHNNGAVRRVTVDGSSGGYAGVRVERKWPGPTHFNRIHVKGCQYGLTFVNFQQCATAEHLWVENQTVAGLKVEGLITWIRGVRSTNSVPVVKFSGDSRGGLLLVDGNFSGGSSSVSAIQNLGSGKVFVRDVVTSGYRAAVDEGATPVTGTTVGEYATNPKHSLWAGTDTSLRLQIKDTPDVPYAPTGTWQNVASFGVTPANGNNSPAFQAAIDSGATHLYFPPGNNTAGVYNFGATIVIRGSVQHINFGSVRFQPTAALAGGTFFRLENVSGTTCCLEHFWYFHNTFGVSRLFEGRSNKVYIFKDFHGGSYHTAAPASGALGEHYRDDVMGELTLAHAQNVWTRQNNGEGGIGTKTSGGDLWVFGQKSDIAAGANQQALVATAGRVEILGMTGFNNTNPQTLNCVDITNIPFSVASWTTHIYTAGADWNILVEETRAGVTRQLPRSAVNRAGANGSSVNLFRSGT